MVKSRKVSLSETESGATTVQGLSLTPVVDDKQSTHVYSNHGYEHGEGLPSCLTGDDKDDSLEPAMAEQTKRNSHSSVRFTICDEVNEPGDDIVMDNNNREDTTRKGSHNNIHSVHDNGITLEAKANGSHSKAHSPVLMQSQGVQTLDIWRPENGSGKAQSNSDRRASLILERIRSHFLGFTDADERVSATAFKEALGEQKGSFFAERFFDYIDENGDGFIDMTELVQGASVLLNGTNEEKLDFIFKLYDMDGDGEISREELYRVLTACVLESHMHFSESNLHVLSDALFDEADVNGDGRITQEELRSLLDRYPDILEGVTLSAANWLQPTLKEKAKKTRRWGFTRNYFKNNAPKLGFFFIFALINVALFIVNAWLYRNYNGWLVFARGCGMCLDFCSALVILLPLRMSLSYLRTTWFAGVLPLDHNVFLHKLVGWVVVIWSVLHTVGHLGNAVLLTDKLNLTLPEILFTTRAHIGWAWDLAPLTGVILLIIVVLMFIMSLPIVRRSGYFEVFYWSHKLYIPYYVLSILHAPHFWKWVIAALVIFLIEALLSTIKSRRGGFFIKSVSLLPSGVTQLEITRSPEFKFHAGDYVYLRIPAIAKYEWHPFTISSAPEQEDTFWVHIRSAGHWTRKVREYFLTHSSRDSVDKASEQSRSQRRRASSIAWFARKTSVARARDASIRRRAITKSTHVQVYVEGPYGSGCRSVFDTEHAILIGSGIGVTPFASILQSVNFRFKSAQISCPQCQHRFYTERLRGMKLKKVDFVWINRDQRHFEWFTSLLGSIERDQSKGLKEYLAMHMYMTGAPSRNHMQGVGLQVALDIVHNTQDTDLITGLQTRTQAGRPDIHKLLSNIKARSRGNKLKVFMCGSPSLSRLIRQHCEQLCIGFSKEQF